MGINTDLNIDPYFDDFSEEKQFNRILFRPAVAVQARELTQLQTILQNQVERLGGNVFKEGAIVSGINFAQRDDINFVKITDSGIPDPSVYTQTFNEDGSESNFKLVGQSTGLEAEIILGENGFETRNPNLKTFYIKYLNTQVSTDTGAEIKQFEKGESLTLFNPNGTQVANAPITVATVGTVGGDPTSQHAGRSFGISIKEGIIFAKGHFLFVEEQFAIISKYDAIPDNVSVGFTVQESIVDSNEDSSLLDNAQGFNNFNAPGADRLRLRPVLTAVDSSVEPEEFFALARYENGQQIGLRDVSPFNAINTEMARRTFEESGNYVVNGMDIKLIRDGSDDLGPKTFAAVSPGKAYVFGYEVRNIAPKYLRLEQSNETVTKTGQGIGVSYGQYYEIDTDAGSDTLNAFALDTTRHTLKNQSDGTIGSCVVKSVEPGKLFVYDVRKNAGEETTPVAKVADTPVKVDGGTSLPIPLKDLNNTAYIFDAGNPSTKAITNVSFTKRLKILLDLDGVNENSGVSNSLTIPNTSAYTPLANSNILLVNNVNKIVPVSGTPTTNPNGDVVIGYDPDDVSSGVPGEPAHCYIDVVVANTPSDTLQQIDVYLKTVVQGSGRAELGLPNVVKILNITNQGSDGTGTEDVTGRFTLVNNAKDAYYDKSYLKLKPGATAPAGSDILLVKATALRRVSTSGNGFLNASSYMNVDKNLIRNYSSKGGKNYNLLSSLDFRPYVDFNGSYAVSPSGATNVGTPVSSTFTSHIPLSSNSIITGDIEYYLSRYDSITIDSTGKFEIVKGNASENPSIPLLKDRFVLGNVYVPGNIEAKTGDFSLKLNNRPTKNYTMEDIAGLEKTVSRLTEAVSLSMLQLESNNLTIQDGSGNNRFKNGILVDTFKTTNIADFSDPDFRSAIDKSSAVATPALIQFPIDLRVSDSNNSSIQTWNDITTIGVSGTPVSFISQKNATNFRNAASNFYNYVGKAQIHPEFDSGYDVVANPDINVEIDEGVSLLQTTDTIQEFVSLTRPNVNVSPDTRLTANFISGTNLRINEVLTQQSNNLPIETTNQNTQPVAEFVTDIEFNPFIEARDVRIYVTGLRPNTIHNVFFDQTLSNDVTRPATLIATGQGEDQSQEVSNIRPIGALGDTLRTDANGTLAAVLSIPAETYYVGEHEIRIADVDQYDSIDSGGNSRAKATYHAYNFNVSKTNVNVSTRVPSFEIDEDTTTNFNTANRFVPDPRDIDFRDRASCFVEGTLIAMADGSIKKIEDVKIGEKVIGQDGQINTVLDYDHPMLDGRELIGINGLGEFMTPEHPVMTKEGWKAYRIEDTIKAYPHLEDLMVGNLQVGDQLLMINGQYLTVESLERYENNPEQRVYNFILDGNNTYHANGVLVHNRDPLAQTFFVKSGMAQGASTIFLRNLDLFFRGRSNTDTTMADVTGNGVTIELREVINGYPSDERIVFGRKHLAPSEVNVSQDGSVATNVVFDNPVRLGVEKEYALVVMPDANDPNYLVYTSKVGGTDLNTGISVTQDWGDGVLFTSTNNKAWKSYQDEDVKFTLRRLDFSANTGIVNLEPNDSEFFTVGSNVGQFVIDELVYATKDTNVYTCGYNAYNANDPTTSQEVTIAQSSIDFDVNNYVYMTQGTRDHIAKVLDKTVENGSTIVLLDTPPVASLDINSNETTTIRGVVAGKCTHFNVRRPESVHLKESSATETYRFLAGDTIKGFTSGATASITTIDDIPISYMQPMIYMSNSMRTSTQLSLKNENGTFRNISPKDNSYLTNEVRKITSKSNIVNPATETESEQKFSVRITLSNDGYLTTSPIVDNDLSRLNVYQYQITELVNTSSSHVTKNVVLEEGIDASGLKVLLTAYRPPGTMIDVYAKFTYPTDAENPSDWIQLDLSEAGKKLFSNASKVTDYREFEYDLDEAVNTEEFGSFKVRFVLRHATDNEIEEQDLEPITKDVNVFPHLFDYRAIAVT